MNLRRSLPPSLKNRLRPLYAALRPNKYWAELGFWQSAHQADGGAFNNSFYRGLMLGMAGEEDASFLAGKIVLDFGCGPRGSLVWATPARLRVGVDVLVDRYAEAFPADLIAHGMVYVKCTERVIPVPSDFADVVYTLNAMDHVNAFPAMCRELLRILRPGGDFIGSFNLEEPRSPTEPQRLTEETIRRELLDHLEVQSYRATLPGPENVYSPFFEGLIPYEQGRKGVLWTRARKPG